MIFDNLNLKNIALLKIAKMPFQVTDIGIKSQNRAIVATFTLFPMKKVKI